MDKLAAMRAFMEVADRGTLKQAASALGKSPPTMVRLLAELEAELGVVLMRRSTRRMSLTKEGEQYLQRCRAILNDIRDAESELTHGDGEPRGALRVTAPSLFGQMHVAPAVVEFARQYPHVSVDVLLLDRVVNLVEEGVDVAVRIGPLADSALVARTVGHMPRVVVASPALLQRVGTPQHPDVLRELPCVRFAGNTTGAVWRFEEPCVDGQPRPFNVTVNGRYCVNQAAAAVQACVAGLGFGRFLAYQSATAVAEGRLVVVLSEFERAPVPVSLVFSQARLLPPRLRVFLDWLAQHARVAAWDAWP